jgi:hypothetical protein
MTVYAPEAVETAALVRIYLAETDRDLDKAVLGAFSEGASIPEKGLRASLLHVLKEMKSELSEMWELHERPRSEIPRRLRTPVPGSTRSAAAKLISDAILATLLGKEPRALQYAPKLVLGAMFPELLKEASLALKPDFLTDLRRDYGSVDLTTLIGMARTVDVAALREACKRAQILSACLAAELLACLLSALANGTTGEELDALFSGPDGAFQLLASGLGVAVGKTMKSDSSQVVLLGLELLALTNSDTKRLEFEELADRYSIRLHFYGKFLGLMLCLRPLHLSELLGPSPMSEGEREEYVAESFKWLLAHVKEIRAAFATPVPGLDDDAREA